MSQKAHAAPTKEFFVYMVTRDITLEDCILDLLDNCLDGSRKDLKKKQIAVQNGTQYKGYSASIRLNAKSFVIEDNCGGISLDDAVNYAFHFGRRPDAPPEGDFAIGLYGIGMKRAIFKLGKKCNVRSSTKEEAFLVKIDVAEWLSRPSDWDFDLESIDREKTPGTRLEVGELNEGIPGAFVETVFQNQLRKIISRDYSFFLQKGFAVSLNGTSVAPYAFTFRHSDAFEPVRYSYVDEIGVEVEITAGMAGLPPEDTSPESTEISEAEYYGWFVACNDRIVLAGDKSTSTVWGDEFPAWHFQYNGFMGIANFRSSDPRLLPWTTTKREVDLQSPVYLRAITHMKKATRSYIDYTNARKNDLEAAKALELAAVATPIRDLPKREDVLMPQFVSKPRVEIANISYAVPKERALKVADALGNRFMTYKRIGHETFEYYFENEVGESK